MLNPFNVFLTVQMNLLRQSLSFTTSLLDVWLAWQQLIVLRPAPVTKSRSLVPFDHLSARDRRRD